MITRTLVLNKTVATVADFATKSFVDKTFETVASVNVSDKKQLCKEIKKTYGVDISEDAIVSVETIYRLYELDDETFYKYASLTKEMVTEGYGYTEVPKTFRSAK